MTLAPPHLLYQPSRCLVEISSAYRTVLTESVGVPSLFPADLFLFKERSRFSFFASWDYSFAHYR